MASGHYFYIRVKIPDHKAPRLVDEKLLRLYDISRPAWRRERRNLKKSAGIHYLRHDWVAVIMLTRGRHEDFYRDHSQTVADIRRQSLNVFGYSIRLGYSAEAKRTKVFVRLDDHRHREIREHLLTVGTWDSFRDPGRFEREVHRFSVQFYKPVFEQFTTILKHVNRVRRKRGLAPIDAGGLPNKVQPTKVFTS